MAIIFDLVGAISRKDVEIWLPSEFDKLPMDQEATEVS